MNDTKKGTYSMCGKDGVVLGLVSGAPGEASPVTHSIDTVTQGSANKHMQFFHHHKNLAISIYKQRITNPGQDCSSTDLSATARSNVIGIITLLNWQWLKKS